MIPGKGLDYSQVIGRKACGERVARMATQRASGLGGSCGGGQATRGEEGGVAKAEGRGKVAGRPGAGSKEGTAGGKGGGEGGGSRGDETIMNQEESLKNTK